MIVTAGVRLQSFADAAYALGLSGLTISARHVQQLTREVGADLAAAQDAQAAARRHRVLAPRVATAPAVVAVEVDGGRLRTRAAGRGPGVHEAQGKEDKIACLVTLTDVAGDADPCPEPPPSFVEPRRIQRLVQQMASRAGEASSADESPPADEAASESEATAGTPDASARSPRRLVRTCVASLTNSRSFGPLMAGEVHSRNFYAAGRRAFVADGQAYNWTIQRGHFPDFVPVVDLLHVVCYLFGAAQAVGAEGERWSLYLCWLRACWQGQVAAVLEHMATFQERLGRPPPGEDVPATDPRRVLAEALTYLRNNASRMDYPRYRAGVADDEQPGGVVGGGIQCAGQGEAEILEPPGGGRGDPARAGGAAERRRSAGPVLRRTPRLPLPPSCRLTARTIAKLFMASAAAAARQTQNGVPIAPPFRPNYNPPQT